MNKKDLKYFFILLISMVISEILNGIVYLSSYSLIEYFITKILISYMTAEKIDIICRIIVAIFAVLSYLFMSKKIFCKFSNKRSKHIALVLLSVIIVLSYLFARFSSPMGGLLNSIHLSMCSPVAYALYLPFLMTENTIPLLSDLLFILLSPISVLLIWLFSKINIRNRNSGETPCVEKDLV